MDVIYAIESADCNETRFEWLNTTEEQALDFLMNVMLNTDKDEEWKNNVKNNNWPSYIEEKDGKLYCQWMTREYKDNLVFTERDHKPHPSTISELRTHLRDYDSITVGQTDRNPVTYQFRKLTKLVPSNWGRTEKRVVG